MAVSQECCMITGLAGGVKHRLKPVHSQTSAFMHDHNRFYPYIGCAINKQSNTYETYFESGYYPGIMESSSEAHNFITWAYNQQLYNRNQQTSFQWASTFNSVHASTYNSVQNLGKFSPNTETSNQVQPSSSGKDRCHPFYSCKRVEPAEGMTRTKDKYRVVYTEKQRRGLEKEYNINKFITTKIRAKISKDLGLSTRQIKIWFQNRRAKERRDSKKEKYTEETENCCTEDDNDTNKYPTYGLDNTNKVLTSCRYTGNENTSDERQFTSDECRFSNYTETHKTDTNDEQASISCLFESRECQNFRPSTSPSEWRLSSGSLFSQTVDVSPLTGNSTFNFDLRM